MSRDIDDEMERANLKSNLVKKYFNHDEHLSKKQIKLDSRLNYCGTIILTRDVHR